MPCLTCLVFSYVYGFFLKQWYYIKIFVLHEEAVLLPKLFCHRLTDVKRLIDLLLFYGEHFCGFSRFHGILAPQFLTEKRNEVTGDKHAATAVPTLGKGSEFLATNQIKSNNLFLYVIFTNFGIH